MFTFFEYTLFSWKKITITTGSIAGLVLIVLLSWLLLWFIRKLLRHQVERQVFNQTLRRKLFRLIKLTILLVDVILLFKAIGLHPMHLMEYKIVDVDPVTITFFHVFVLAIVILVIQFAVLGIRKVFDNMIENKSLEIGIGSAVYQIIKYLIWIIAIILLLDSMGVKITILVAGAGALLIGIGFGVQQIFSDIISGFILLFERNLKVHDVVEADGIVGRVLSIGLRTTRMITRDNIEILIPNTKFIKDNVVNWSHLEKATRFYVGVDVPYGSDVRKVERLLLECASAHPDVLQDPEPFVFFKEFGEYSLYFEIYFWTHRSFRFESIRSDIRFAIDEAFRKNNIHLPYPQRDIHIRTK